MAMPQISLRARIRRGCCDRRCRGGMCQTTAPRTAGRHTVRHGRAQIDDRRAAQRANRNAPSSRTTPDNRKRRATVAFAGFARWLCLVLRSLPCPTTAMRSRRGRPVAERCLRRGVWDVIAGLSGAVGWRELLNDHHWLLAAASLVGMCRRRDNQGSVCCALARIHNRCSSSSIKGVGFLASMSRAYHGAGRVVVCADCHWITGSLDLLVRCGVVGHGRVPLACALASCVSHNRGCLVLTDLGVRFRRRRHHARGRRRSAAVSASEQCSMPWPGPLAPACPLSLAFWSRRTRL